MGFVLFTARRYLFGRSRLGATGWISLISALAIAVVTAALVCVLAVYNGYVLMLLGGEMHSYPDLLIKPREAMVFSSGEVVRKVNQTGLSRSMSGVLVTQGVLRSSAGEFVSEVYGVDSAYHSVVGIDSALLEGKFVGAMEQRGDELYHPITIGIALAVEGLGREAEESLSLLFPRREGMINPLAMASAFVELPVYLGGVLPSYNEVIDRRIYTDLEGLREALNYSGDELSALAIGLRLGVSTAEAKASIGEALGDAYLVLNREEQQPELTFLIKTEKLMVYAIMCFILILAAFNLASSLAMLIMEKEQDLRSLSALGATSLQIRAVFATTGLLISSLGSLVGLLVGVVFCLLQQRFGFISSGEGLSRMPFPISLEWQDLLYIILATSVVALLSASIPPSLMAKRK